MKKLLLLAALATIAACTSKGATENTDAGVSADTISMDTIIPLDTAGIDTFLYND